MGDGGRGRQGEGGRGRGGDRGDKGDRGTRRTRGGHFRAGVPKPLRCGESTRRCRFGSRRSGEPEGRFPPLKHVASPLRNVSVDKGTRGQGDKGTRGTIDC
ncbi:MAG: hypothetical protein KME31_22315 [Tolypothrix carrinoi HA7290-LM1]|nr:hypothetical protein [Tolypothrix carrinoi HA7290-LM1]